MAAFQPGLMSSDSLDQYSQGLSGAYNDIHPPLGSLLLGISGKLTGSPWPVLMAQLLAMGLCMAALVRSPKAREGRWGLVVMGLFLLTPTVWALAVTLWKDVMTAAVLLGAVAALKFRRPAMALVLLMAGVAFRHNAIIAAAPLAIPAVLQWAPKQWSAFRKSQLLAVALVGLVLSPSVVSRALGSTRAWAVGQLFLYDLAGIYAAHPELVSRSMLSNDTSGDEIVRLYTPLHVWQLFGGVEGARPISFTSLDSRRKELRGEWARMIREQPSAWLRHRWASFESMIGASPAPVHYPFHLNIDPNSFQLRVPSEGWLYKTLHEIKMRLANTLVFRGWAWLLLLGGIALVALRRVRQKPIAFCTAMSGLGYALAYLFIGIGSDFRFIYWSIITVFATLALLLTEQSPQEAGTSERGPAASPSAGA
ncbi:MULTISPECIES: hypothetical protein [unclassified Myxococcus]|uniref:hypothetical protein n=1 Tax=unclassified Myxococcus TaxID=2648731 RepID=UPI0020CFCC23|nr:MULTISPECIES: hypothetical protein [unclassified Myxococcus]